MRPRPCATKVTLICWQKDIEDYIVHERAQTGEPVMTKDIVGSDWVKFKYIQFVQGKESKQLSDAVEETQDCGEADHTTRNEEDEQRLAPIPEDEHELPPGGESAD